MKTISASNEFKAVNSLFDFDMFEKSYKKEINYEKLTAFENYYLHDGQKRVRLYKDLHTKEVVGVYEDISALHSGEYLVYRFPLVTSELANQLIEMTQEANDERNNILRMPFFAEVNIAFLILASVGILVFEGYIPYILIGYFVIAGLFTTCMNQKRKQKLKQFKEESKQSTK